MRYPALKDMIQGEQGRSQSPHVMALFTYVQLLLKFIFQRLDHSQVTGNPAGKGNLVLDAHPPEQGRRPRSNRLMNPEQNILDLLSLAKPGENLRFGKDRTGRADPYRFVRLQRGRAELIQGNIEGTRRGAEKPASSRSSSEASA